MSQARLSRQSGSLRARTLIVCIIAVAPAEGAHGCARLVRSLTFNVKGRARRAGVLFLQLPLLRTRGGVFQRLCHSFGHAQERLAW